MVVGLETMKIFFVNIFKKKFFLTFHPFQRYHENKFGVRVMVLKNTFSTTFQ
jgi:hypothetical protein